MSSDFGTLCCLENLHINFISSDLGIHSYMYIYSSQHHLTSIFSYLIVVTRSCDVFIVLLGANNSLRIIGTSGITQMIRNQTVFDIPTACLHGAVVSIL